MMPSNMRVRRILWILMASLAAEAHATCLVAKSKT
jgi:hypothetical protein